MPKEIIQSTLPTEEKPPINPYLDKLKSPPPNSLNFNKKVEFKGYPHHDPSSQH